MLRRHTGLSLRQRWTSTLFGAAALFTLLLGPFGSAQVVTFAGWSAEEDASREVIFSNLESFEKQSGIEVDWLGFPWSDTQTNLILRYRSNEAPQISQLAYDWLNRFAALDALVDFNDVLGQEFLESSIDPGLLNAGRVDGKQLGLPWTIASISMVANTKVLGDAGVSELPITVDAFVEALEAVKASNPDVVPYAFTTKENSSISPDFQVWLRTYGGQIFDDQGNVVVDSEAGVEALAFLTDLMERGLMAKDVDRFNARQLLAQHQTAFYFDAPLARGFARDNSGEGDAFDQYVAAMPTPVVNEGDVPQSTTWGHVLVLFKQPQDVTEESPQVQLAEYLSLSPEPQLAYLEAVGLFPVSKDALAAPQVSEDPYIATWAEIATDAQSDATAAYENSSELTDAIGEEVQEALLGRKTPEQAIADMASRLRDLVQ